MPSGRSFFPPSWDSAAGSDIIDKFVIDVFKDPTGVAGRIPPKLASQTLQVPFDGSISYSVVDDLAGRSASKTQVYTMTVVLTDGTRIVVAQIVYTHGA